MGDWSCCWGCTHRFIGIPAGSHHTVTHTHTQMDSPNMPSRTRTHINPQEPAAAVDCRTSVEQCVGVRLSARFHSGFISLLFSSLCSSVSSEQTSSISSSAEVIIYSMLRQYYRHIKTPKRGTLPNCSKLPPILVFVEVLCKTKKLAVERMHGLSS